MALFEKSQEFYDKLYAWKDYESESKRLVEIIDQRAPSAQTVLDVACGTGKHIELLQTRFECEGLDLDQKLLNIARKRLASTPFHKADMTNFDLGREFDVVTCLFSAIGSAATVEGLNSAIESMARHTKKLLIVEPWFAPDQWHPGRQHALFVDEPKLKVARMSETSVDGTTSVIWFHYLISTPDGVRYEKEEHRDGLFTREQYEHAFRQAGLQVEFDEAGLMGRGLYLGTK